MQTRHAITKAVAAVIIIVVLIVAAALAISFVYLPSTPSSTTSTTTTPSIQSSTSTGTGSSIETSSIAGTGTGGGGTSAYDQNVLACAQKEGGALTIYGLSDASDINAKVLPPFNSLFPWAKVSYLGLSTGDLTNKVLAEHKAAQVQGDLIMSAFIQTVVTLNQSGAIMPYDNPMIDKVGYPANLKDPANLYSPWILFPSTIAYNTNVVKDTSKLPKTWVQFFTDPTWQGQVGYQKVSVLGSTAGFLYVLGQNMTSSQFMDFLNKAAANKPVQTDSQSAAFTAMTTGEIALTAGAYNDIVTAQQNSSNIGVIWPNPVFAQRLVNSIVAGTSHPCMAELFEEYSVTMQGQLAIGSTGRVPALQSAANQSPVLHTPSNVTITVTDDPGFLNNQTYYGNLFKQVFGA